MNEQSTTKLIFWDVQHGSAAYIRTPKKNIVVDLGSGSYGTQKAEFSPLLHLKYKWNVDRLDGVIITHPHRDHLDDIVNFGTLSPRVLARPKHLTDDEVLSGNRDADRDTIDKYLEINHRYNEPVSQEDNPFLAQNNGGLNIQKFTPTSCETSNLNNHSIVTVAEFASSKVVIPGDNEPSSWDELLQNTDFVSAIAGTDILVAPHHGRDSGFSDELFNYISPRLTIISDGRFCDTSATDRYAKKTQGWKVHKRGGRTEERKCVTTRNDGVIAVELGRSLNNTPYIKVTID